MSKGKKFDAAQKHFESRLSGYSRKIRELRNALETAEKENAESRKRIATLEMENAEIKEKIAYLQKYADLNPADLQAAVQKDARLADAMKFLQLASNKIFL